VNLLLFAALGRNNAEGSEPLMSQPRFSIIANGSVAE
jgi:hypothetical protein